MFFAIMKVLNHHIYEYKKGIRNLILHTLSSNHKQVAVDRLEKNNISYIIREISADKINIFFGAKECINVIEAFGNKQLNEFTPEEDFILGIMLGYNRLQQCDRYLKKTKTNIKQATIRRIDRDHYKKAL